jgi:hypothetical protein
VEFEEIYEDLIREGREGGTPVKDLLSKLIVIYMLERVSAQSKNLCEEVVFALTGDRKQRRPVRVIFLDGGADAASRMAAAIGNKAFPEVGVYAAAGLASRPAESALVSFMEEAGHGIAQSPGETPDLDRIHWRDYDVIVSLEGPLSDYVGDVPVGTVAFEWPVPARPGPGDPNAAETYRAMYHEISTRLHDLMDTMRGLTEDDHHG